jgi:hypothetical protein
VLKLAVTSVDTSVTQSNDSLIAHASGATYQWLDCDNNFSPVSGATNQVYVVSSNGSYAVEVTQNGCTDTSGCHPVIITGLGPATGDGFHCYPNPAGDVLNIRLPGGTALYEISLYTLTGQKLHYSESSGSTEMKLELSGIPEGIYILSILSDNLSITRKIIH